MDKLTTLPILPILPTLSEFVRSKDDISGYEYGPKERMLFAINYPKQVDSVLLRAYTESYLADIVSVSSNVDANRLLMNMYTLRVVDAPGGGVIVDGIIQDAYVKDEFYDFMDTLTESEVSYLVTKYNVPAIVVYLVESTINERMNSVSDQLLKALDEALHDDDDTYMRMTTSRRVRKELQKLSDTYSKDQIVDAVVTLNIQL